MENTGEELRGEIHLSDLEESEQKLVREWIDEYAKGYLDDPDMESRDEALSYAVEDCMADALGMYEADGYTAVAQDIRKLIDEVK